VRSQLELSVGDAKAFPARSPSSNRWSPSPTTSRARSPSGGAGTAELTGRSAAHAGQQYQLALDSPSHLIHLKDNIDADVHALALQA
jgi:hypothetical protein